LLNQLAEADLVVFADIGQTAMHQPVVVLGVDEHGRARLG
jgi:hypothetical protein